MAMTNIQWSRISDEEAWKKPAQTLNNIASTISGSYLINAEIAPSTIDRMARAAGIAAWALPQLTSHIDNRKHHTDTRTILLIWQKVAAGNNGHNLVPHYERQGRQKTLEFAVANIDAILLYRALCVNQLDATLDISSQSLMQGNNRALHLLIYRATLSKDQTWLRENLTDAVRSYLKICLESQAIKLLNMPDKPHTTNRPTQVIQGIINAMLQPGYVKQSKLKDEELGLITSSLETALLESISRIAPLLTPIIESGQGHGNTWNDWTNLIQNPVQTLNIELLNALSHEQRTELLTPTWRHSRVNRQRKELQRSSPHASLRLIRSDISPELNRGILHASQAQAAARWVCEAGKKPDTTKQRSARLHSLDPQEDPQTGQTREMAAILTTAWVEQLCQKAPQSNDRSAKDFQYQSALQTIDISNAGHTGEGWQKAKHALQHPIIWGITPWYTSCSWENIETALLRELRRGELQGWALRLGLEHLTCNHDLDKEVLQFMGIDLKTGQQKNSPGIPRRLDYARILAARIRLSCWMGGSLNGRPENDRNPQNGIRRSGPGSRRNQYNSDIYRDPNGQRMLITPYLRSHTINRVLSLIPTLRTDDDPTTPIWASERVYHACCILLEIPETFADRNCPRGHHQTLANLSKEIT